MGNGRRVGLWLGLGTVVFAAASMGQADPALRLIDPIDPIDHGGPVSVDSTSDGSIGDGVVRLRAVEVASSALATEDRMVIDLFDGDEIEVVRSAGESRAGATTWIGRIASGGGVGGDVVLAAVGNVVVGTVFTSSKRFALRVDPDSGDQQLVELDTTAFAPCDGEHDVGFDRWDTMQVEKVLGGSASGATSVAGPVNDPSDRIDVMVLYTPEARAAAGGVDAIAATIAAAVASANLALANSAGVPRFSLVHAEQADYVDSGLMINDLQWLRNHPTVHALRDSHGADLVAMLVEDGGGACGRAYVQRVPGPEFAVDAFSVTARACAVDNLSFAHELAHNQGCEHDPVFGVDPDEASFPWSFGHFEAGIFRTVMAYSGACGAAGCPRQPLFSSPQLQHLGLPVGIAEERDNVRTINATAAIVANFRPRAGLLFWDDFEDASTAAWELNAGGN